MELKKPVRPPLVVALSNLPRIMKSISVTGSPSRTIIMGMLDMRKHEHKPVAEEEQLPDL
ncbi:hypothetical protein MUK42_32392 [Musa troglodytarum]|uniref:Uncharacterized protein n=1 Tax=Musa troglodytarum TaxID=320322 RepID=A0A9E7F914_9LILI|nr:hypothetical protein MUK42_32392 [Musa troglodytarum]